MEHLEVVRKANGANGHAGLEAKASGEYFTPELVGRRLVSEVVGRIRPNHMSGVHAIDPFCGDGRLLVWLLEEVCANAPELRRLKWQISAWDISSENVSKAYHAVEATASRLGMMATLDARVCDSFIHSTFFEKHFDIAVTNPPWELLKPDVRELRHLDAPSAVSYVDALKSISKRLASDFPRSMPSRKFSGWGINLSRVGLELALRMLRSTGEAAIVMPTSFLADQTSAELRQWAFENFSCSSIFSYPAECRSFEGVDQPFSVLVLAGQPSGARTKLFTYDRTLDLRGKAEIDLKSDWMRQSGYCVPVLLSSNQIAILQLVQSERRLGELERGEEGSVWLGRELDETNLARLVASEGSRHFFKGRHIERYAVRTDQDAIYLREDLEITLPPSVDYARLVWRDVSRPNQKRRIQAMVIPPGPVTGNSLGVLHAWRVEPDSLYWLLGVMSSLPFEYQVRALSRTGHVSGGVVRQCSLPKIDSGEIRRAIEENVRRRLLGDTAAEVAIEVLTAKSYGLDRDGLIQIAEQFPKLTAGEIQALSEHPSWLGD